MIGFLPNLEEFTVEQVRMKPTYIDLPPFEWQVFYAMNTLYDTLDGMKAALREWLDNPPSKEVDAELAHQADHEPGQGDAEARRQTEPGGEREAAQGGTGGEGTAE